MALRVYFSFHYTVINEYPILNHLSYKKTAEISNKVLDHFRKARYKDFDIEKISFPGLGRGNLGTHKITNQNTCVTMIMHFESPRSYINDEAVISTIYKLLPDIFDSFYLSNTEINTGYFVKIQFTTVQINKYEL
jgi:hypothetical protein